MSVDPTKNNITTTREAFKLGYENPSLNPKPALTPLEKWADEKEKESESDKK